jgi:hypothetical protein
MELLIIYPVFTGISVATAQLAHYRGYSARWWFAIATLLPIVSLIVLFFLKKRPVSEKAVYARPQTSYNHKVVYRRE